MNVTVENGIHYHTDKHPGLTMNGVEFTHHENHGKPYWKATAQIGTLFGQKVEGELTGIGWTKEQALERLEKEHSELYESLWA